MILELVEKVYEAKDTSVDLNKQFQIAIVPDKKAIVVKQLFGYFTKYPIYIDKLDKEIESKIVSLKNGYDIDVINVGTDVVDGDSTLIITVNVDSKDLEDTLQMNIVLSDGKEEVKKV